ncbi:hypothetical protein X943_001453 [Babesia divergens]|uniref:Uncharacterized protein n=1 Tax=Babesia divergens TaxID=32595 RepID=A0AAD9GFE5_BABDI|nr:hypothetical protein X943_001453 [Babesia divergens]
MVIAAYNLINEILKRFHCAYAVPVVRRTCFDARLGLSRQRNQYVTIYGRRMFSEHRYLIHNEMASLKSYVQQPSQDLSYVYAATIKERAERLRVHLETRGNDECVTIAKGLESAASSYEEAVLRFIDNRVLYNQVSRHVVKAMQTKVTRDSNIKYGIMGISLICIFGSLSISLHPVFLFGCAIGAYVYRPVFRQSRLREDITKDLERYLHASRDCRRKLGHLQVDMANRLEELERKLSRRDDHKLDIRESS